MACFDSHIPPTIPVQSLPGVIIVVLGGQLGLMLRCQMAGPMRGWMLQPVCWPVRQPVR